MQKTRLVKRILYVSFLLIFVVYLCFANRIAVFLKDGSSALKSFPSADFTQISENDTNVASRHTAMIVGGDFMQIMVEGSAFCEGAPYDETGERHIALILTNGKKFYSSEATTAFYREATNVYGEDIPSHNLFFAVDFSTLNIPDGIYEAYVYVQEANGMEGTNPLFSFEKQNGKLTSL